MSIYTNPKTNRIIFDSAMTVRCTQEQRNKWNNFAKAYGVSLNALIRIAVNHYISLQQGIELPVDKK